MRIGRTATISRTVRWTPAFMLCALLLPSAAVAYPTKPLRLVVPFPAGGPVDITARTIGPDLSRVLGQPVVIDNRAGAGGIVATDMVARAAADGYTLLLGTVSNAINQAVIPKLPFDLEKDLAPVTMLVAITSILVVHPGVPANSVSELIALAKAKPGELRYASAGNGTPGHLAAELFKFMAGVDLLHVPYKGAAPALIDVISGQVHLALLSAPGLVPHIHAKRLKGLAVTNAKRSLILPDLPTIAESGLPGFEAEGWHGIFVPRATPPLIVESLNRALLTTLNSDDVRARLIRGGAEPIGLAPQQFANKLRSEIDRWSRVVKSAGIKAD